ncbi:MAG: type-F conjugative transfer system secretin TraK [Bdellovibrionaceae bacterium]|nr:type-F conjugative transfer system secretin TraK [Pseudobdellovibrionaceae bacterium]
MVTQRKFRINDGLSVENIQALFQRGVLVFFLGLYFVLFLVLTAMLASRAEAKTVVYGTSTEQVRIKYGVPTIFRFQKAVQTITGAGRLQIEPANKVDPSYKVLSVNPRFTNGVNEVTFFLTDNTVVRTKVLVSPTDPAADTFYDFKARDSVDGADNENAPPLTEVELLKAMYRDDAVSGYKIVRMSQAFPSKNGNAQVELVRIYQGNPFNGYVFKVKNTSWRKNLEIDVRHVVVGKPNMAILSQSDDSTLYPKGKGVNETFVRVVAKNTTSSRDVILAMESEEAAAAKSKGGD